MKRSFARRVAPALLLAVLAIPTAGHATTVTVERKGAIKVVWNQIITANELIWDCETEPFPVPDGGFQGVDAYILKLPENSAGQRIEMTELKVLNATDGQSLAGLLAVPDIDWYFYDADCDQVRYTGMATGTPLEKGVVPSDDPTSAEDDETAVWAIAFLFAGPPSYFTVEIDSCSANEGEQDTDGDSQADACDADDDNDGLTDEAEEDLGTDPLNADTDADAVADANDNCPTVANPGQEDIDEDEIGDACDPE